MKLFFSVITSVAIASMLLLVHIIIKTMYFTVACTVEVKQVWL